MGVMPTECTRLREIEEIVSTLKHEANYLTHRVIPGAQFRLEDISVELKNLNIEKAKLNLNIAGGSDDHQT